MIKLLSYLKGHGKAVAIIFILLLVQVYCDLALPQYTSDLVDVGIQQAGIEDSVPEYMSGETMDNLSIFLDDSDMDKVESAYEKTSEYDDAYEYTDGDREELSDILSLPMAALYMAEQSDEFDMDAVHAAIDAGYMTEEDIRAKMEEGIEQYTAGGDYSESLLSQAAIAFIGDEYEKIGVDKDRIQMKYLWHKGFQMFLVTLLMMGTAIGVSYFASKTAAEIGRDTRKAVFSKVMSFGHGEMDKFSTASLITRSTNDIQQIQITCVMILRMVSYAPIMGIGACIKVAATKTGMAWVTAVAVALIIILIGCLVFIAMPKFKIMQTLIDKVNLVSREIISGIPVIRAFSREKHEEGRFNAASYDLMKTQIFTHRTMSFMSPAMMIIMNGISVLIVWVGSKGVDAGNMQVGDMMAFITYTMMIVASFMMLAMIAIIGPRAMVAAGRIDEVLSTEVSVTDREETVEVENPKGEITFDHVWFRYPGASGDVLADISFTAKPGETTAIIGSTGCGKSTLINLIPRFYDVSDGKITIDGVDIRDLKLHDLRELIGYVPQKGVLFSGDIRSNIKFADEDMSEERMIEAARIAQAENIIAEKPDGYESSVAQGGTNVSGGQKQRLSIARAIAKDPLIYIFDDSFSALDYKTDAALRKALNEKTKEKTVLIVAQRIATILHADRIIVLDEGEVAGIGTHEQLLKSCSTYMEIARSQLSEEELKKGGGADE